VLAKALDRLLPVRGFGNQQHVRLISNDGCHALVQKRVIINAKNTDLTGRIHLSSFE
jgi:hypothetical protein